MKRLLVIVRSIGAAAIWCVFLFSSLGFQDGMYTVCKTACQNAQIDALAHLKNLQEEEKGELYPGRALVLDKLRRKQESLDYEVWRLCADDVTKTTNDDIATMIARSVFLPVFASGGVADLTVEQLRYVWQRQAFLTERNRLKRALPSGDRAGARRRSRINDIKKSSGGGLSALWRKPKDTTPVDEPVRFKATDTISDKRDIMREQRRRMTEKVRQAAKNNAKAAKNNAKIVEANRKQTEKLRKAVEKNQAKLKEKLGIRGTRP